PVSDYVFSFPQTREFMKKLEELIAFTLPLYREEGKTVLVIAIGCTGGHHRSVAVTRALADYIAKEGYQATENHRDMTRA
ncbi:MAG: RNase adapter RapZ, partial [Oscillospiraceae bacterium]